MKVGFTDIGQHNQPHRTDHSPHTTVRAQNPNLSETPSLHWLQHLAPIRPPPKSFCRFLRENFIPINQHPTPSQLPVKMSAQNKIAPNSPSRASPSELEQNIAQALYDLETNTADLKVALRPLQFVSAREVRTT
ncbi:40S ribosomal protein S7 like [Verticillium longisporum]|uniref:40S ribosomal protein S7 like n=1 Tax=Verticillium longisporum TaxID=100787 RepID=A0A8I2Z494_VERLO|nr:40S ribosomal protein S7 like [Verticillium longisporum]